MSSEVMGGGYSPSLASFWGDDNPPATVWHYTTAAGLLGILEDKCIWATNIEFLNDASENMRMWELVAKRIQERISPSKDSKALRELQDELVRRQEHMGRVFVSCFSAERDSLSQWRAYSAGSGYSIGFSYDALAEFCVIKSSAKENFTRDISDRRFSRVKYISEEDTSLLDDFIDNLLNLADPALKHIESFPHYVLRNNSPFVKDSAFRSENEWRFSSSFGALQSNLKDEIKYRPGRSHLVPYLAVSLRSMAPGYIKEILVGPGPSRDLDVVALKDFKEVRELKIDINPSVIPFRNW
jgi:hypothetical protein